MADLKKKKNLGTLIIIIILIDLYKNFAWAQLRHQASVTLANAEGHAYSMYA